VLTTRAPGSIAVAASPSRISTPAGTPGGASVNSSAEAPSKYADSRTRSYAGRFSSPSTVTAQRRPVSRATSASTKRWPTMPLPITTSFMRLLR
jgi:hypothetical protein